MRVTLCLPRVPWSHFCCIECKNMANIADFLPRAIWTNHQIWKFLFFSVLNAIWDYYIKKSEADIWSQSWYVSHFKLNFKSANLLYKRCSVWYVFLEYYIKVKAKLAYRSKAVISSLSTLNLKTKYFFYKSCSVWNVFENMAQMLHKKSFCQIFSFALKNL